MIVVETRLKEIFDTLPEINGCKPVFGYGTDIQLNEFLAAKVREKVYPLIWLVYPNEEIHDMNGTTLSCPSMTFILASNAQKSILNDHRIATIYNDVLNPLFDNVIRSFSNTVSRVVPFSDTETFRATKFPNYTNEKTKNESKTISPWDAIRLNCSLDFNNCQLEQINY
jgi:hypothetical protein